MPIVFLRARPSLSVSVEAALRNRTLTVAGKLDRGIPILIGIVAGKIGLQTRPRQFGRLPDPGLRVESLSPPSTRLVSGIGHSLYPQVN